MTQANISPHSTSQVAATLEVRVEHVGNAFGIGTDHPRLSWIIETESQGWRQSGYEIEEYDADGKLMNRAGREVSDQSVLVDWPFPLLQSRERVSLRVRDWGTDGDESAWSKPVLVEAGLLHAED